MVIGFPDVSKDFPKLVKTLALLNDHEFEYWTLILKIYENRYKVNLETYFKKFSWILLDKPYPCCEQLDKDLSILMNVFVTLKEPGTTNYLVNVDSLNQSPLSEYAKNEAIPILVNQ